MKEIRVLICVPHVFSPKSGSLYGSETAEKIHIKRSALRSCCNGNLDRFNKVGYVHQSLGKGKEVVTRRIVKEGGIDLTIQVYLGKGKNLSEVISRNKKLELFEVSCNDMKNVPAVASRKALEQWNRFDIIGYMEDDISIEDEEFFEKILFLNSIYGDEYVFMPHRFERATEKGEVVLSGDPEGGRDDLFWDTGETISVEWGIRERSFYRATNPHSGCFFLTKEQARICDAYWRNKKWIADFVLAGPLEHACTGILLPIFRVMKPCIENYEFLKVLHQDELWRRHRFENKDYC